jgi:predicted GH43/DUF377 family glycosyl hydrolase
VSRLGEIQVTSQIPNIHCAPPRVIGRLRQPLLRSADDERDGYVPNVVYSCGGLIHHDQLWLPYAVSDRATRLARVALPPLLEALQHSPPRQDVGAG